MRSRFPATLVFEGTFWVVGVPPRDRVPGDASDVEEELVEVEVAVVEVVDEEVEVEVGMSVVQGAGSLHVVEVVLCVLVHGAESVDEVGPLGGSSLYHHVIWNSPMP